MKICVIGSGVVGQATGKGFMSKGHDVTFGDINSEVVDNLRAQDFSAFTIDELNESDYDYDMTIFTVSTPTVDGAIKIDYLKAAAQDLGKRLAKKDDYHVVTLRSTVPPGTSEEVLIPIIEYFSGKKVGEGFGFCMNPEYLREVSAADDFANPWIIVFGEFDKKSGDVLEKVYENFDSEIHRIPLKEAELQKYVHNLYNAVKIGFFNEMRDVAQKADIDADVVFKLVAKSAESMWNAEYGTKDFGPFTGSCLPKDTRAFLKWGQERGWDMPLLKTTVEENEALFLKNLYKATNI